MAPNSRIELKLIHEFVAISHFILSTTNLNLTKRINYPKNQTNISYTPISGF